MAEFFTRVQMEGAAAIIRNRSRYQPTVGIVLGSGLSAIANEVKFPDIIPTDQIPHWPVSTVSGHSGRLILGRFEEKVVMVVQGRAHFYEGYTMDQITLPIRVMHILGIQTLIVTNAAGGLNESFAAGDIMLIKDHINLPGMAGNNPLRGPNDSSIGARFPDMNQAYNEELQTLARDTAVSENFSLQEGVYAYVAGPTYETPAELRFLRQMGADAVGMSTVPSVLVARHAGMHVLGLSTITNMAIPDQVQNVTHDEVLEVGKTAVPRLKALLQGIVRQL